MMILIRFHFIVPLILSVIHHVSTSTSDIVQLKNLFIQNLLEENRGIASSPLTDEIERSINLKIQGFLNIIDEPSERTRRGTNDLLLNERTSDIFILKGFDDRGFVPINFPQDICMFQINRKIFAVGLSFGKMSNETLEATTASGGTLSIFLREDGKFRKIHEYKSRFLTKIDCRATSDTGFVAVVNTVSESDCSDSKELHSIGSFVYRIFLQPSGEPKVELFQKITLHNQNGVQLWSRENSMYLVFSYNTNRMSPLDVCTVFKLTRDHFDPMDNLPCQNAKVIEFFTVHHNLMVFVGNYQENNGTTNTFSYIMSYDLNQRRFVEHQKISTSAVTVGKYFYWDHQNQRQHFLFVGNSFEVGEFGIINYDAPSVIYRLVNGFFIPMQTLNVKNIKAMLPILGNKNEFHFLVASEDHEMQIYFYDGWRFLESPVDFTGNAFSEGVVSMRAYNDIIQNTTTIVIANRNSFDSSDNVYTPIYAMKNDSSKLKSSITKWCSGTFNQLEEFDVDEADEVLRSSLALADPASDQANFMGKVFLENSTVELVKTKELRGTRVMFTNETALRYNSLTGRVNQLSSAVQHVNNKIRFTKATQRNRRQAPMLIKTLIVDGPLSVQSINGRPISDLVYKSNRRNVNLKDIKVKEMLIKKELFVNEKIDGLELRPDNVLLDKTNQILRPLAIENLSTQKISDVATVNGAPFGDFFRALRRKVDRKVPNTIHQLNVDTLSVGDSVNGNNFTAICVESLKTTGNQELLAPVSIGVLRANKILFQKVLREQKLSEVPLSMLIDINETRRRQDISQDVRFTEPLNVSRLFVSQRINNINVVQKKLQVLRKSGLTRQSVSGEKFFDQIHLLSPIVLQGKIESKTLQKMNPIATIGENLVLQGDYKITGPVSVRRLISATEDMTSSNPSFGLKNLADNGLNLFTSERTSNKLIFKNVVDVKGNLQAVSLNQKQVAKFVKTNFPDIQTVKGRTTFKNGLFVHGGTVQADIINDVDINQLNRTILRRFSPSTQFIDGNVEIVNLRTQQIISPDVKLNGKSIDLVLNANKDQDISGRMILSQAKVRNVHATNLNQQEGGKVFGSDLNFLIDDTITKADTADSSYIASKTFTDMSIERLEFSEQNEWKSIIANYENSIAQDLNFTGNLDFKKNMNIGNLIVSGTINGVSYDDMTTNWLQSEGPQVFTAPQTLRSVSIDGDMGLSSGTINGVNVTKMIQESIWIDAPVFIDTMSIDGEAVFKTQVMSPLVNGASLDGKLILNNTNDYQTIKKIVVDRNAAADYIKFANLNGIDCARFVDALAGTNGSVNLIINGNARFNFQPAIVWLNNVNLQELHDNVWLLDRDIVLTGDNIQFLGGVRSENAIYSDTLNGMDLLDLNENYFSLTKNQNIPAFININGTVFINSTLSTQRTIVQGTIKPDLQRAFKIEDFAANVLRMDREQEIKGNWSVRKLVIEGDYDGTINGLNFYDDVLHAGNLETAEVTGSKRIAALSVHDVQAKYINEIDIPFWLEDAVNMISTEEQYINGKVELQAATFYEDIQVDGTVNDINIRPETVLTKSGEGQVITGDLTLRTRIADQVKQMFIDNLYLDYGINGRNLTEVYANTLKASDAAIYSKHLTFARKLTAGAVETDKSLYGVNMKDFLASSNASASLVQFQNNLRNLIEVGDDLKKSHLDVPIELSHFEHHQSLPGVNVQKTVPLKFVSGSKVDFSIAVHDRNTSSNFEVIRFFNWDRKTLKFVDDGSILSMPFDVASYQITKIGRVTYKSADHLFVEVFDKNDRNFYQSLMLVDSQSRHFLSVSTTKSIVSAQLFTLNDGSSACFGSIFPTMKDLSIICENEQPTILKTDPIRMVSSQNDLIILLTDDHQLQIWHNQKIRQVLKVMNPQSFTTIRFNGKFYLAVSSDRVEQSIHHGSIEIFESFDDINFVLVQSLEIENPFLVKFSVIPSGDLLLYILTRNPGKSLGIYKYAGASYFVENIGSSTIVNTATDLSTMKVDNTEFIAVVSGDVFIIEAVLKEF